MVYNLVKNLVTLLYCLTLLVDVSLLVTVFHINCTKEHKQIVLI